MSATSAKKRTGADRQTAPRHDRSVEIIGTLVIGLLITGILIAGKSWIEKTVLGRAIERMGVDLVQSRLATASGGREIHVAVVDITDLSGPNSQIKTSRPGLGNVVQSVAAANPLAIGIDIIFEPDENGLLSEEDSTFLAKCLNLKRSSGEHIPVVVGLGDAVARGPGGWLGEERFASLGAEVLVPRPKDGETTDRMLSYLQIPDGDSQTRGIRVPSLSYALAHSVAESEVRRRTLGRILNISMPQIVEREWLAKKTLEAHEFEINFGALSTLKASTRATGSDGKILNKSGTLDNKSETLENKVVLIGRAQSHRTNDQFVVSTQADPLPGVYVQAAAVDTLLDAPLFKLNALGRICADLLAASILLGGVFVIEWRGRKQEFLQRTWIVPVTVSAVAAAIALVAWSWVDSIGVYWADFILVILALLLHNPIERLLQWLLTSLIVRSSPGADNRTTKPVADVRTGRPRSKRSA